MNDEMQKLHIPDTPAHKDQIFNSDEVEFFRNIWCVVRVAR